MSVSWPGNTSRSPPVELEEVSWQKREVWASLLRLLSLQPGPGLMKRKLCCIILQRKDRTFAGIEMCWWKGNKVLCKSEPQIWRFKSRKWTWNLVDIFEGRLHNCTLYTKHTHTHAQYWGSFKGVWLLAFFLPETQISCQCDHDPPWLKSMNQNPHRTSGKNVFSPFDSYMHLSCVCLCNLFFLPACRTCSLLLLLAPCQ